MSNVENNENKHLHKHSINKTLKINTCIQILQNCFECPWFHLRTRKQNNMRTGVSTLESTHIHVSTHGITSECTPRFKKCLSDVCVLVVFEWSV